MTDKQVTLCKQELLTATAAATPKEYFIWCKGPFAWMFGNTLMVIAFHDGSVWEKGPFGFYFRVGIDRPY